MLYYRTYVFIVSLGNGQLRNTKKKMSTGSGNAANMKYAVSRKMPIAIFEMGGGGMYKRMNARMHLQLKQTQKYLHS